MLHGKNMAIMSDLNSKPTIFRVPGPIMDVSPHEEVEWTGGGMTDISPKGGHLWKERGGNIYNGRYGTDQ